MIPAAPELQRRPPPAVPFTVLTGFLGAGKTTLLNRLLSDPVLADTLVLINEFGEIGLDHLLVERVDGDTILMASGCVCCTIRGDLVDTLEDVLRRLDHGRMKPFQRVIVETTGLADPAPVLHTVMRHPYLQLRFRIEGVVTLVDAVNGLTTLDRHPEAVKQAAIADRIVITKSDLCQTPAAQAQLAQLRTRLHGLNPSARILDNAAGEAGTANLLDTGPYDPEAKTWQVRKWLNVEVFESVRRDATRRSGEIRPHGDSGGAHDARIHSFVLTSEQPIAPPLLQLFLDMLQQLHGPALLRMKGIVSLADDPTRPLVIHGVQHVLHPPVRLERWPDDDHSTRIVFIVCGLDPDHVRGLWGAFSGGIAIDRPDAAALSENPLKPGGGGLFTYS